MLVNNQAVKRATTKFLTDIVEPTLFENLTDDDITVLSFMWLNFRLFPSIWLNFTSHRALQ